MSLVGKDMYKGRVAQWLKRLPGKVEGVVLGQLKLPFWNTPLTHLSPHWATTLELAGDPIFMLT